MIKYYIKILFVISIIWCGCENDESPTSPTHSADALIGTWELKRAEPAREESWKYVIFTSENYYYQLLGSGNNLHDIYQSVFSITENQIDFSRRGLYIFNISNDTLTLSTPDYVLYFVKNNNAPTKDEWVIPVKILKEIPLPGIHVRDMTFDGANFWLTNGEDEIIKIDSLGNVLTSYKQILHTGGITCGNGVLYVSHIRSIKKIDPSNGEIISTLEIQSDYSYIRSLGYENGYIWAMDLSGYTYTSFYKIDEHSGGIMDTIDFYQPYGVDFENGQLWTSTQFYVYSIDANTGNAINTYDIIDPHGYGLAAINYDGNNYWAGFYNSETNSYSLVKLDIK